MADGSAKRSPTRDIRTICLPCSEEEYRGLVGDARLFRAWFEKSFAAHAELFPDGFAGGLRPRLLRAERKPASVKRRTHPLPRGRLGFQVPFPSVV